MALLCFQLFLKTHSDGNISKLLTCWWLSDKERPPITLSCRADCPGRQTVWTGQPRRAFRPRPVCGQHRSAPPPRQRPHRPPGNWECCSTWTGQWELGVPGQHEGAQCHHRVLKGGGGGWRTHDYRTVSGRWWGIGFGKEEGSQAQECSGLQGRGEESGLPQSLQREPDILVPGI